ncbi:MAG: YebC/PmpR family DNA-binding transcriptional regulator [Chlamydiota bacterium]
MAGHSKWANIKHKKERADQKKGKLFSQLTKELISAVKAQGSDPKTNPRLRALLEKAKKAGLSKETIERNLKKATDPKTGQYVEVTYELYGHGGVGILALALTDNKNRTASSMRIATQKRGGAIASPGSVSYNFQQKGTLYVPKDSVEEDALFLLATDLGAEDFLVEEEGYLLLVPAESLYSLKEALDEEGISSEPSLEFLPKTTVKCGKEEQEANEALIDFLDADEDIHRIYHNMAL